MDKRRKISAASISLLLILIFGAAIVSKAKANEYEAIVSHLKTKYQAKKVNIPLMWLARFAVRVARPAGVKSFSVTMFENLRFSTATLDREMQSAMKNSMGERWSSILRVRSRVGGEQIYMYMRDAGRESVKIMLVTIDRDQAAVIRAKIDPERLAEFVNNPKIFGISLDDKSPIAATSVGENDKPNVKIVNSK